MSEGSASGSGKTAVELSRAKSRKDVERPEYGSRRAGAHSGEDGPKKDAPRTSGEVLRKVWIKNPRRNKPTQHELDDVGNEKAFLDHAETIRSNRKKVKVRIAVTPKGRPYCRRSEWLFSMRSHRASECLFMPGANHGIRSTVLFNFKRVVASRAMCIIAHGTPPFSGAMAIHSCGNGHLSCVNPAHLRWGDTDDNHNDDKLHHSPRVGKAPEAAISDGLLPKVSAVRHNVTADTIRVARGLSAINAKCKK